MIKKLLLSVMISSLAIFNLNAQVTTAGIKGTIKDENGKALHGVAISALHQLTGTKYFSGTDAHGFFNLPDIRYDSPYKITISYIGYENHVLTNVTLVPGQQLDLKVSMVPEPYRYMITTAGGDYPGGRLGADTNFVYSNAEMTLWLSYNHRYSLRVQGHGIIGAGAWTSTGIYKIKGDSLVLQTAQYFRRPVTMLVDTFKQNKKVTLLSVKNKKVLSRQILLFNKNKAFIEGLPVGIPDTFDIKEIYNDYNGTGGPGCFPFDFYGEEEPDQDYTYYLPFSEKKEIAIRFYQPSIKIRQGYTIAFKIENDRIILNNINAAAHPIEMRLEKVKGH